MDYFTIKDNGIPKYQQLIDVILKNISEGELEINDKLPSLNYLMKKYNLSQDTVLNSYNYLKTKGIITSTIGKGYYIISDKISDKHKVFLLFDNFTFYKELLYNSISSSFQANGTLDIYFHHNNPSQYKKLIEEAAGNYTSYIIMAIEDKDLDDFLIKTLPPKSVFILDIATEKLKKKFPFVAQNFEKDVIECLNSGLDILKKYSRIRFLNSSQKPHILRIKKGLSNFATNNNFPFSSISEISKMKIEKGDLFFVIKDSDLVKLIEKSKLEKIDIGKDIGIISYNETDLKKVMHNGVTTVSTDFELMGHSIADLVQTNTRKRIYNKAIFTIRDSV